MTHQTTPSPRRETPARRERGAWIRRLRLRVLAVAVAGGLMIWALVGLLVLPAAPVIGVTVITVAALVNSMTAKLRTPVCHACSAELPRGATGAYGVICTSCGAIATPAATPIAGDRAGDRAGIPTGDRPGGLPGDDTATEPGGNTARA